MEAFDVRRPAILEPKPEQTICAQPLYGGFIGKEINDFFAELCRNYPGVELSMWFLPVLSAISW